jgi:L-lactate dehydrogenase complex protein LldG
MTATASEQVVAPNAREVILARIRAALRDVPAEETAGDVPVARDYREAHADQDPRSLVDLLAHNLADYRAHVHRTDETGLAQTVGRLIGEHGSTSYVAPEGVPAAWMARCAAKRARDNGAGIGAGARLSARALDAIGSVVTGCAVAIAETGTIVLDGSPDQGRRALTLVPDHHVCVIRCPRQVVASVGLALPRLDPRRPLTWISGPSATSDIEFTRVEGVHGPRTLDVILLSA